MSTDASAATTVIEAAAPAVTVSGVVEPQVTPLAASSSSSSAPTIGPSKGGRSGVLPISTELLLSLRGTEPDRLQIQTEPKPTIAIVDQFKSGLFPPGQIILYHQDANLKRCTAEETRHNDRILADTLQSARHGAEVHRQVRKFMHSYIKPGLLMTEICETLEGLSRKLVKENGLHAGIAFPTGCSLNHVAAHYTPNTGDMTRLSAADVMKIDFGVHVNGRIIDCAWTWAPDPKFKPLLDAVQDSTDTGIRTAGIDVRLCDVGAAVEEVMQSYEIELDKKIIKIKTVRNLNGHSIDPYKIHGPKCLGRDTPVLMLDGSVKPVQAVAVGDLLVGDDGAARRVLATTAGRAAMYEIASVHSAPFTCNGAHILSLRLADLPARHERADGSHVVSYAAVQRRADGTVSDFDVCERVCPSAADARAAMAQCDVGTLDIAVDDVIKMTADKQSRLRTFRIAQPLKFVSSSAAASQHDEPFDALVDSSIPSSLKRGSVATREALLDAVVDACGKRHAAAGATIAVHCAELCDDVEFVARSLGRCVTRVTDVPRAAAHALYVAPAGTANEEPLAIVALPDAEFFGFAIDGNHRFVLGHSFVVTHNSVPNVSGGDATRMEEGEFYAIETFGSTGKGHVVEDGECSHFMKAFDAAHVPIRMTKAKQLLGHINRTFDTLAFCRRWLDGAGQKQYIMALKNLCDLGVVHKYPPLVDRKGSHVAQFEHTIFLRPTCKEVVSRGDDY